MPYHMTDDEQQSNCGNQAGKTGLPASVCVWKSGANPDNSRCAPNLTSTPSTLDHYYDVELADGRIIGLNTILKGCTLNFLNHQFNVNLMHVELGSFDAIIGLTGTDNYEKDEKQSQNDKTGLGMEKTVKDKAQIEAERTWTISGLNTCEIYGTTLGKLMVQGYDGLPMQPVAPPSPDYVPGPEHPASPDYMSTPRDQPLPADASPVALSPGYVPDSDPEEDPEEDSEETC
ncbi:hypothetical protein Tco_0785604 [Tanacetum coccineum]